VVRIFNSEEEIIREQKSVIVIVKLTKYTDYLYKIYPDDPDYDKLNCKLKTVHMTDKEFKDIFGFSITDKYYQKITHT